MRGLPLKLYNLLTDEMKEIHSFTTPEAFIFLYEFEKFLVIWDRKISIWNSEGEFVSDFGNNDIAMKVKLNDDEPH